MIDTKMRIIRPFVAGAIDEVRVVALSKEPGFDVLRALIEPVLDGGDLERVAVWADFAGGQQFEALDMFVDDTGLQKGLKRNDIATEHYRRASLMGLSAFPTSDPELMHAIYGVAILFDRRVWF